MKKYTIKDKSGTKKTIYAKDLAHALTFVDSKIKDDYLGMVKINGRPMYIIHKKSVGMPEFWGITPDKWGDNPKKKFKSKKELDEYLKSVGATDSIKDEANLPTTLQALVNDEEAAIKAYEVAIKNLEGKIDETQMQVLINIMKDERRHVENLYAILNGQVTEKNLEDSIHDCVNDSKMKDKSIHHEWLIEHAKRLYEYAKIDNFGAVKREAENLIDCIDNNNLG